MNNYWRMMEQVTLSDRKKEEIMEMLENKNTQKRRMPKAGKLILAAALAVGCVLSIAAAMQERDVSFDPIVGITVGEYSTAFDWTANGSDPIVLEDGRLWFVEGDTRTDITDIIDENTPCYRYMTDEETGEVIAFLAVGGTPEDFGFWACARTLNEFGFGSAGRDFFTEIYTYEGETYEVSFSTELPKEVREAREAQIEFGQEHGYGYPDAPITIYKPWAATVIEQLDATWALNGTNLRLR